MARPASRSNARSSCPRTDSLRTTRRDNVPLPPYNGRQNDEGMFSQGPPQVSLTCAENEGSGIPLEYLSYQPTDLDPPQTPPQAQMQNRKQEISPPPPYPESAVPSPRESAKINPETIKQPFEEPYLLPISETRVISTTKRGLTKKQKRKNKCLTRWCVTVLIIAIALVFGVVGVSVWRHIEEKESD